MRVVVLVVASFLVLCGVSAFAMDYEVGPGKAFEELSEVPWEGLQAGDTVLIYPRAQPYRDKFVLCRQGTESAPITVRGVLGAQGERPVIDGRDASTRSALNYWNEARGVIKVGGANVPADTLPSWIVIENLEIRSARPPYGFTGRDGQSSYPANAAAIFIEKGEHVVIRNCVLHDSGNGLFVAASGGETRHILVEHNHLYGNGNEGSAYEHNSYTAAIDIVFQFNHYGPLREGCNGNNLKDRSAGLVVRYNWIESGNRQLDLVDAEDSAVLVGHPSYSSTQVYGNVLIEPEGAGNSQIVHYGGDSGTLEDYRKGTLFFHHNTVISTRTGNTTLFRLSTNDERAVLRNNIFFVTGSGASLALMAGDGQLELSHNWLVEGYRPCHCTPAGSIVDDGSGLLGLEPGFVDRAAQDFALRSDSVCVNASGPLATGSDTPSMQYVRHQAGSARPDEPPLELGAFETCVQGSCEPVLVDESPADEVEPLEAPSDEPWPEVFEQSETELLEQSEADLVENEADVEGAETGLEAPSGGDESGCSCALSVPRLPWGVAQLLGILGLWLWALRRRPASTRGGAARGAQFRF